MLARALCERVPNAASPWNFGPAAEDAQRVIDVVAVLQRHWSDVRIDTTASGDGLHEANLLELDSTRANTELGWTPIWSLEEGLQAAAEWYRGYFIDPLETARLSNDALTAYEARAAAATREGATTC
jgi:CDP-glucose 4,6-dehydratase